MYIYKTLFTTIGGETMLLLNLSMDHQNNGGHPNDGGQML